MNDYMCEGGLGGRKRGDEDEYEEEDAASGGQGESCQGVIEKIKDGGMKTLSFIAGEGATQLARLSSTELYSSFNRSVSDSQHKSLHYKMAHCVCESVCWRESGCACMWQLSMMPSASQPARTTQNPDELQEGSPG